MPSAASRPLRGVLAACVLLVCGLVAAGSAPARGTSAAPLTFDHSQSNPQSPVEQQTPGWYGTNCPPGPGACQPDSSKWVVNPTGCPWDIDDNLLESSAVGSYLDPGRSASVTNCLVADDARHLVGVIVNAGGPGLEVTLSYQPFGYSVTIPVRSSSSKQVSY